MTLWEALLNVNLKLKYGDYIGIEQFKTIIAILDLNLTLKEKIMLTSIVDPENTGNVHIEHLLMKF